MSIRRCANCNETLGRGDDMALPNTPKEENCAKCERLVTAKHYVALMPEPDSREGKDVYTGWERRFVRDMIAKVERGDKEWSDKQLDRLGELYDKTK